jgi:hypothetical protein
MPILKRFLLFVVLFAILDIVYISTLPSIWYFLVISTLLYCLMEGSSAETMVWGPAIFILAALQTAATCIFVNVTVAPEALGKVDAMLVLLFSFLPFGGVFLGLGVERICGAAWSLKLWQRVAEETSRAKEEFLAGFGH